MERMDLRVAAAIALLAAAFLFVGIGRYGVVNGDEGIYHAIAERMAETGNLLRLDFRGEERVYDAFLNAPLHYWARAALIAAFGSSLVTMRLLSALFGVLTVVATYALGCRLAGRRAGLLAAGVQLSTFQFVYLHGARTGELDTLASVLVAASFLAFLRAVEDGRSFVPHHLAVAALLMTKLPLVAVPVVAELGWLALHATDVRHLPRYLRAGLGALPFALLWHVSLAFRESEHLANVLGTMLGQASGSGVTDAPDVGFAGNARFYAATLLQGALPWSAVYPFAALAAFVGPQPRRRWVAAAYGALVLLFFCWVSKHFPWYVMPAYPFLSILVGGWLADLLRSDSPRAGLGIGAVLTTLLWIGIDFGANPFAERALVVPMQWTSREWLGLSPAVAIAAVGGAWALLWMLSGARIPGAWRRGIGIACAAVCVAYAGLRAVAPLAHLDHQSPLDRIHARVYADLAAGRPLDFPIRLGAAPPQIARFIDTRNLCGRRGDETLAFTRREIEILQYLQQNAERPVSRDELLTRVWGYDRTAEIETRTVDIHVAKLRRKIEIDAKEPRNLVTVRGAGYRLMASS
jgi:4-amino-4-deoxy-L-arabinose transferase-like glycosyltransferase